MEYSFKIILGLIFTCHDLYIHSPFSPLFILQKTMQLAVLKARRSPWPHYSHSHPWTPCRVAPLDPSALGIHWRNGWPALSGVSVMAATSRRFLANRSKNVMDARALIWGHPNNRMTPWKRYCSFFFNLLLIISCCFLYYIEEKLIFSSDWMK